MDLKSVNIFSAYHRLWRKSVVSREAFEIWGWNEIWGLSVDFNYLFYLFSGIICPPLPEVIVIWVFTRRWHFLASALLIISYVIKLFCKETSYIKSGEVTWYKYKSSKFTSVFGSQKDKETLKEGMKELTRSKDLSLKETVY